MLIALTGGIGTGKSTIARRLQEHGAHLVDADVLAREVVDPSTAAGAEVLAQIESALGPAARGPAGTLDRGAVAAIVFGDANARAALEAIVHPAIAAATEGRLVELQHDDMALVVHEIPLLSAETPPLSWHYDLIVVVVADEEERVRRLVDRGLAETDARRRIAAQVPDEIRIAIADRVIRTTGSVSATLNVADELWHDLSKHLRRAQQSGASSEDGGTA